MAGCLVLFILLLISVWLADIFGDTVGGSFFWGIIIISAVLGKIFSKTDADNHQIKAVKNKEENSTQVSVIQSEETPTLFQENQSIPKRPVNKQHRLPKSSQKRSTKEWRESKITSDVDNINIPLNKTVSFLYEDAAGNISFRTINTQNVTRSYVDGYCHDRRAVRTFKTERIIGSITMSNTEISVDHWLSLNGVGVAKKTSTSKIDNTLLEVCFTGFKQDDKKRLEALAVKNNLKVRVSVTKKLAFLVCGKTAGPSKKSQAELNGAVCLSEAEFLEMIESGEIPS